MAVDPFGGNAAQTDAADDFLSGGTSVVAVKFPTVGHRIKGTVVGWQMGQQTDMTTGELKWFHNKKLMNDSEVPESAKANGGARPAMELLLDLQYPDDSPEIGKTWKTLEYIEEVVPDDDGMRRWYISGGSQKALSKALEEAGAKLEKGALVEAVRGKSTKLASGWQGRTFVAKWTKAADNPYFKAEAEAFLNDGDSAEKDEDPFA